MIQLTEEQVHALSTYQSKHVRVVNPKTEETFVLVPLEEFEQLDKPEYGPWTDEETALLAAEAGEMLDSFGKKARPQ
jgi:hypothetical protein